MKNTKKLLVILLLVATFVTLFSVSAMATTSDADETVETGTGSSGTCVDASYATTTTYGGRSRVDGFNALEKAVYYELVDYFKSVANGETTSAQYTIKADLSALNWYWKNPYAYVTDSMLKEKLDLVTIIHSHLLADLPYEMFWYEKTRGYSCDWEYEKNYSTGRIWITSMTISFKVSECYRADPDDYYTISPEAIKRAQEATAYAQEIVKKYENEGDLEKLEGYGKEICSLVRYNSSVASDPNRKYGDPFQIIYVFDQDPDTNVVCEAYAKAFKYLCDISSFDKNISCYIERGEVNRGYDARHMWNVVQINGKNYLTDITACDSGTVLNTKYYFLAGTNERNEITYTNYTTGKVTAVATYYRDAYVYNVFCEDYLKYSETSYHEHRYSTTWKSDGTQHWHECSCGNKKDVTSHTSTGNNKATCATKATCDVCNKQYGELEEHVSVNKPATCTSRAVCDNCGKSYGSYLSHTYDQQVTESKYVKSKATCTSKGVYYYSCVCGRRGTETFEGEYGDHKYTVENTDEQYLKSPADCTHVAMYYYSCSCGAMGTDAFIYGEALPHTYDENNECTECGDIYVPEEESAEELTDKTTTSTPNSSPTSISNSDMTSLLDLLMMIIKILMALFGGGTEVGV